MGSGCIALAEQVQCMMVEQALRQGASVLPIVCDSPMQIVIKVREYFGLHFQESIDLNQLPALLEISQHCLDLSFMQVRGISLSQALQELRLNKLFAALTDQPRQELGHAIEACGLSQTKGVVTLFEHAFGIEMAVFMLTCRRAADDRLFRKDHPSADALVLRT
jgi:transcriptional regulator GlxA family with amidase domain